MKCGEYLQSPLSLKPQSRSRPLKMLIEDSHAYEFIRVRSEDHERTAHGPHFGTKLHAVDRRMLHLTGLRALHPSERYQRYQC